MPSRPTRGAWIEIAGRPQPYEQERSRPTRGAWIEIQTMGWECAMAKSRPTRGAWIEISLGIGIETVARVAPHTGRVD